LWVHIAAKNITETAACARSWFSTPPWRFPSPFQFFPDGLFSFFFPFFPLCRFRWLPHKKNPAFPVLLPPPPPPIFNHTPLRWIFSPFQPPQGIFFLLSLLRPIDVPASTCPLFFFFFRFARVPPFFLFPALRFVRAPFAFSRTYLEFV